MLRTIVLIMAGVAIIVFALNVAFLAGWIGNASASGERTATQAAVIAGIVAVVGVVAQFPVAAGGRLIARAWGSRRRHAGLVGRLKVHVDGGPPTAAQVKNLQRLGIHAAREIVGGAGAGTHAMPVYIPRDVDRQLAEVLASERFVLVVGQSAAGKSRAAFQAVKVTLPTHRIVAPVLGALTSIIDNRDVPRKSVLWLDDLEKYLADGLTPQRLSTVMALPGVVVVATIRDVLYDEYWPNNKKTRQERQEVVAGREVLDLATTVRLQRRFSPHELARASAFRDDERIADAIERADRFGVAEYIAAGPDLLDRWIRARDIGGHPVGAAIVAAAIDCRRAGWPGPITAQMLKRLYGHYLDRYGGDRLRPESFDMALDWATEAIHGTTGLLNPDGPGYVPFDYLIDAVQSDATTNPVPDLVWDMVVATAGPDFAYSVGVAADRAGRAKQAETLFRQAADAGSYRAQPAFSSDPFGHDRAMPPAWGFGMRIRQPVLFVGLGGTGCKVGAELERQLRAELCGPDGTWLLGYMQDPDFLPYQLPSCLQFVYADLSTDELERVRREVVPGREHDPAAEKTMHLTTDLVPARPGNSIEVARRLRVNCDEEIIRWLPPPMETPRIGPLDGGAGQLPTVGRCVLFETVRCNPDTALLGIKEALADINESAGDLYIVSGRRNMRVDPVIVFVVFSVAGGTGSGIFYDYLHLIGDLMQRGGKEAEIYPLVLMPSAFDDGQGGGRSADLNAGSALIDLFRLVDDQNARGWPYELDVPETHAPLSVHYPRLGQVQLLPKTVQTAFLFGRPVGGVRRADLIRSMVSLMVWMIGAGPTDQGDDEDSVTRPYQWLADGFINSKVDRRTVAETGVGRRGVTTSVVASLTTPLRELTDVVSSHLLANAVNELLVPPGAAETNKPHIRNFITAAGLDRLLEAAPQRIAPLGSPVGYGPVLKALTDRADVMRSSIERGQEALTVPVAALAQNFDPAAAAEVLLRSLDLFRLQRAIFGHQDLTDPLDKGGFRALLEGWRSPPPPPPGLDSDASLAPQDLPRKFPRRLRIIDEPAQAVIRMQDMWYAWQTRRIWNAAWNDSHRLWIRPWQAFVEEFRAVYEQFLIYARNDPRQFDLRSKELYKPRVGVAYLLPPEDRGLEGFYRTVLARLKQDYSQYLGPTANEGHVLNLLLGQDGWATAYAKGRRDPEAAVTHILQRIKEAVTEVVRPSDRSRPALVPSMEDLLSNAALRRDKPITDSDLYRFRQKLAELVPGGFAPDGRAPLKGLFIYPAAQENEDIERFLRREVSLPIDMIGEPEYRAIQADSMVVVLTRSSMGITEVSELRRVIKLWADAQRNPQPKDTLAWRRRLSQDTGYLLMDEQDRQRVLHRLLCAAWDGKIVVAGPLTSPDYITVEIGSREALTMKLELAPLGALSSWASVLQAYEHWILTDDNPTRRRLAGQLMSFIPARADRSPSPPAPEFAAIVDLAEAELQKIRETGQNQVINESFSQSVLDFAAMTRAMFSRSPQLAVFRQFWSQVLPAALRQPVGSTSKNLLDLREQADIASEDE